MPAASINVAVKLIEETKRVALLCRTIKNSNRFWHEPCLDIIERLHARCLGKVKAS